MCIRDRLYIVDKVYNHKGLIVVDRYSYDETQGVGRPDTIHLLNILKFTICTTQQREDEVVVVVVVVVLVVDKKYYINLNVYYNYN